MNEFPYQIIQIIHTLFCWRLLNTMIVQICCITWELLDEFCAFLITMQQTEKYPWSWCLLKIFHCWQIKILLYLDVSLLNWEKVIMPFFIPIFLLYFALIRFSFNYENSLAFTKRPSAMLLSKWNCSLMNHDTIILTNIRKREWHLHAICRLFKLNTCFVRILHLSSFSILSSWNGNLFCRHSGISLLA